MPWSIPRTTGLTPICQAIVVCILMDIGAGQALVQVTNREAPAPVLPRLGDARTPARTPQPGDATLPLPLPDDASSRRSLPTQSAVSAPSTTPREAETSLPRGDATLGMQLIPGQVLAPIDLAGALRLAGARDLDIAIARQQVWRAIADLQPARALWLPSLFLGPTWYRLDGKVQSITGQVITTSRSSLFIGGLAASANSYAATPPGSGFPPLTGLSSVLRFSDAILEPRAANRIVAASQADVRTATNNAVLAAAETYFDLLLASGLLAIEREAAANARTLAEITASYARSGAGLEADHQRTLTELDHRRGNIEDAVGQLEVASANLVNLLVLDPNQVLAPVEPAEAVFRLLPDEIPLDEMIVQGLRQRPELASAQELVQATLVRLKQARLRPLVPSLAFSYAGGGFGGGQNGFFGNFGSRGDATVSLYWELQNLGFTDNAIARRNLADHRTAALRLIKVENQVAADVTTAYKSRLAASRRMAQAAGRDQGVGVATAEHAQHSARGRSARCDPADRGTSADPGPGAGPRRLSECRPGLQPRSIPPLSSNWPAASLASERAPAGPSQRAAHYSAG